MRDPAFTYEQGAALNAQVPNPFRNYLTPETFPGSLRNNTTVRARQPAGSLSAVRRHHPDQHQRRPQHEDAERGPPRCSGRSASGVSFLAAYAFQRDRIENFLGDIEEYEVLTSGGESGWEWQPVNPALPEHRVHERPHVADSGRPRTRPTSTTCPPCSTRHPRRLAVHDAPCGSIPDAPSSSTRCR